MAPPDIATIAAQRRAELDAILQKHGVDTDGSFQSGGKGLSLALLTWTAAIAVEVAREQYAIADSIPQGYNTTRSFDTVFLWCTRCPGGTNGTTPLDSMPIGDPDGLHRWFKIMREHEIPHRAGLDVLTAPVKTGRSSLALWAAQEVQDGTEQ